MGRQFVRRPDLTIFGCTDMPSRLSIAGWSPPPLNLASCGDCSGNAKIAEPIVYSGCADFSTLPNVFLVNQLLKHGVFARQTRNDSFKRSQVTETL